MERRPEPLQFQGTSQYRLVLCCITSCSCVMFAGLKPALHAAEADVQVMASCDGAGRTVLPLLSSPPLLQPVPQPPSFLPCRMGI